MAKKAAAAPVEPDVTGSDHWPSFRNVTYVKAIQQDDGSYLVHGARGDVWVVPADEFQANYKPVTPNKS